MQWGRHIVPSATRQCDSTTLASCRRCDDHVTLLDWILLEHRSRNVAVAAAQSQHRLLRCIITVTPSSLSLSLHRERHPILHALPLHNCLRRLGHKE